MTQLAPINNCITALRCLNDDFRIQDTSLPFEGYRVVFDEFPSLHGRLIPMGAPRKTAYLSGIPSDSKMECPFCKTDLKVFKVFQDQCRAIYSHSGQILLIPDKHYAHWFEMPIEEQEKLMKHALEIRKQAKGPLPPLELHCGAAGFQTVFHTHLRTGVFN